METLNDRIKQFYTLKGLTQEEFAEKIGASQQYISAVINNKRNVGSNILKKIQEAFPEIDYFWLLNGEAKKSVSEKSEFDENELVKFLMNNTEKLLENNMYFKIWYENLQAKIKHEFVMQQLGTTVIGNASDKPIKDDSN